MDYSGMIPKARTHFIKVKCKACNNQQNIFSAISRTVNCNVCGAVLATPTSNHSKIEGEIVKAVDS